MKNSSGKSIKALRNIFSVIVILISVFVIAFAGIVDKSGKSLFGYGAFTVSSENLSTGDFSSGDVIVTKAVPASVLKSEDMIAFVSQNEDDFGETAIRHIRSASEDGFVTYNSVTGEDDAAIVASEEIIGKYLFSIPGAGSFFAFLKTVPGYILCVFIPVLALIIIRGISSVSLFKKYRDEQLSEMENTKNQTNEYIYPQEPENTEAFEEIANESEPFKSEPLPTAKPQTEPEIIEEPETFEETDIPEFLETLDEQPVPENAGLPETETEPSLDEMLAKLRYLRKDLDLD